MPIRKPAPKRPVRDNSDTVARRYRTAKTSTGMAGPAKVQTSSYDRVTGMGRTQVNNGPVTSGYRNSTTAASRATPETAKPRTSPAQQRAATDRMASRKATPSTRSSSVRAAGTKRNAADSSASSRAVPLTDAQKKAATGRKALAYNTAKSRGTVAGKDRNVSSKASPPPGYKPKKKIIPGAK